MDRSNQINTLLGTMQQQLPAFAPPLGSPIQMGSGVGMHGVQQLPHTNFSTNRHNLATNPGVDKSALEALYQHQSLEQARQRQINSQLAAQLANTQQQLANAQSIAQQILSAATASQQQQQLLSQKMTTESLQQALQTQTGQTLSRPLFQFQLPLMMAQQQHLQQQHLQEALSAQDQMNSALAERSLMGAPQSTSSKLSKPANKAGSRGKGSRRKRRSQNVVEESVDTGAINKTTVYKRYNTSEKGMLRASRYRTKRRLEKFLNDPSLPRDVSEEDRARIEGWISQFNERVTDVESCKATVEEAKTFLDDAHRRYTLEAIAQVQAGIEEARKKREALLANDERPSLSIAKSDSASSAEAIKSEQTLNHAKPVQDTEKSVN